MSDPASAQRKKGPLVAFLLTLVTLGLVAAVAGLVNGPVMRAGLPESITTVCVGVVLMIFGAVLPRLATAFGLDDGLPTNSPQARLAVLRALRVGFGALGAIFGHFLAAMWKVETIPDDTQAPAFFPVRFQARALIFIGAVAFVGALAVTALFFMGVNI